ncbi:DPBB and LysM peptidoglycan-binding domain-containing protein [Hymenobacter cheonanensis]|uniref:DPBB and LysM peptidoglycan-binding domain-containing protein n=1 Tax=Hymenobacter sp. CA2-7 TaxID=3063993 RepID=UPI002712D71E|nr:LysM peptidoglycan-binding domain-containing protein [Hymenobacter sp. CA2-7]MDO7887139.1 LysM peptidoglycan-binding domain-containing protein [Hymenobacter sp. CA2-7]
MSLLASFLILNSLHGPLAPLPPSHRLPTDSIGQEMRGGQRFVRHRVAQGETMFALSRRYHVTVDQITAANPQLKTGLGIGEVVLIPRGAAGGTKAAAPAAGPARLPTAAATAVPDRYTVAKGETLFGIARRFNLAPADLILYNHLPAGGAVRVGQELLLRAAEGGTPAVAASPAPAAPEAPAPKINPAAPAQVATVTPATPAERREEAAETKSPTHASELVQRKTDVGIATAIANNGTDKYLALHKTAPVGTIMQVKNQMNGQSVYVRVIGTLPDTGENENILVRLSPRAVQKLGTTDAKFRVETSYVP